jgi:dienelactone hydrolase
MNEQGQFVKIEADSAELEGNLNVPEGSLGVVLFAHGSGSSRHSPRNNFVADYLRKSHMGTLLFDLLTEEEDQVDRQTRELRFNIDLLAERLTGVTKWLLRQDRAGSLPIGYFGASTGAAAALKAAASGKVAVNSIVSRGGRPDLAGDALTKVTAPVLLIVGGLDTQVIEMNKSAFSKLKSEEKDISIVEGATHLFEEPGKLEEVAERARSWFDLCFQGGC